MYILSDWRSRKQDVTLGSNSIEEERHFLSFLSFFFFFFLRLSHEAYGILFPWPGIEPRPQARDSERVLTGLPGNTWEAFSTWDIFLKVGGGWSGTEEMAILIRTRTINVGNISWAAVIWKYLLSGKVLSPGSTMKRFSKIGAG